MLAFVVVDCVFLEGGMSEILDGQTTILLLDLEDDAYDAYGRNEILI
jgi:hypothetical protein